MPPGSSSSPPAHSSRAGARHASGAALDGATDAAQLAQSIETYLADNPSAAVLEGGRVIFDLRTAHYSITESHGRCLLQLWSEERNMVRTVVNFQLRAQCLRVLTRRMGAAQPEALEFVANADRRTPTSRDAARRQYLRLLERVLTRQFVGSTVEALRSAMDLEHSFGPAYVRGRLVKGTRADAVIGVGAAESSSIIDGVLTLGILWLEYCRGRGDGRRHIGGLKVIVPAGTELTTAQRMAWLNHKAAAFTLYTLDERTEELLEVDLQNTGNLESRLVHAFSPQAAVERCQPGIDRVLALVASASRERVEVLARSSGEVGLLLHGLEFARVRFGFAGGSFAHQHEVTFGAGRHETPLTDETEELCREMLRRLFLARHPDGVQTDPLYRLQPERWLESCLRAAMGAVLPGLRAEMLYSQVPALSSSDRGMLDLLTLDAAGRLVILELKANEDLHLPMQALDYWIRVRALNADRTGAPGVRPAPSAFERNGYFAGAEVSPLPPRLLLAAPALRIHPANEPVLRSLSPQVEWELIALAESWRRELSIVFRKRSSDPRSPVVA